MLYLSEIKWHREKLYVLTLKISWKKVLGLAFALTVTSLLYVTPWPAPWFSPLTLAPAPACASTSTSTLFSIGCTVLYTGFITGGATSPPSPA